MPSSSTTDIYSLSLHDALPISSTIFFPFANRLFALEIFASKSFSLIRIPKSFYFSFRFSKFSNSGLNSRILTSVSFCLTSNSSDRSEEHTSELQSRPHLVCRLRPPPISTLFPYTTLFRSPQLFFFLLLIDFLHWKYLTLNLLV